MGREWYGVFVRMFALWLRVVGAAKEKGDTFVVAMKLTYRQGKQHLEWTDELVLAPLPQGWQVSDIRFGGKWAFQPDPMETAKLMIAHIDKKRKALGLDKARERVLFDMAMRRELA